jgi:hypothetical protein
MELRGKLRERKNEVNDLRLVLKEWWLMPHVMCIVENSKEGVRGKIREKEELMVTAGIQLPRNRIHISLHSSLSFLLLLLHFLMLSFTFSLRLSLSSSRLPLCSFHFFSQILSKG